MDDTEIFLREKARELRRLAENAPPQTAEQLHRMADDLEEMADRLSSGRS
jgi:hypothetical protein